MKNSNVIIIITSLQQVQQRSQVDGLCNKNKARERDRRADEEEKRRIRRIAALIIYSEAVCLSAAVFRRFIIIIFIGAIVA